MELIYLIIGLIVGFLIGYLLAKTFQKNTVNPEEFLPKALHENAQNQIEKLEKNLEQKEFENADLIKELATQEQITKNQEEKLQHQQKELENLQEKLRLEFEHTANKLLEEKSEKFTQQNQKNIDALLSPLQEKIKEFSQKVEQFYGEENRERATLKEQIRTLTSLNTKMSEDAQNLTNALKGESKTQGQWGELLLEKILEQSGLRKEQEYFTQSNFQTEHGKRQLPDIVIHLPNERHVVIDSKMSLTAYERYCSNTEQEQVKALKEHLHSLKKHAEELSAKKYQQISQLNSPDFVLMFVPLESAFALAMQHDHQLFYKAFEKNVIIVSPITLLATIRIIANIWQLENQNKYAQEIARQSGLMYDKFVNFIEDMEQVGRRMTQLETSYNDAFKKLHKGKGNLIDRAEKLRELGANNTKKINVKYIDDEELE